MVQTVTGDGFGNGTDTMVYINLIGTLGDSGKRFLVHNMEETERKFQTGQVSILKILQFRLILHAFFGCHIVHI